MFRFTIIIILPIVIQAQIQGPVVEAVRITTTPIIDGRLDEPCWQQCNPLSDFYMYEPNPGAPVTQATTVYICYDDEKIYFGIHLAESKKDKIQAAINQRDGGVYMDDSFEIIIDTHCDRKNAYYFMSNLLGTKLDGRIIDEGQNTDANWDAYWDVKAQIVEDGWEMEFAIPFSELSFPTKDTLTWGLNFIRIERPHWENTSWSTVQSWCQISRYGTLTGLAISAKTKRFEFLPYGALRNENFERESLDARAGVDFEYDITSNLIFNATLWPDFAQIEADPYQFNLSYQEGEELYFPEKRTFFLEGSSILSTPFNLFYTRRMNKILAGGKLYGKVKSTELLVIDVQTEDTEENFSLLRIKQDLFNTTTVGALATHKENSDSFSQAAGIDFNQSIYAPFNLISQFAATRNSGDSGDIWAGHIGIEGETSTRGAGIYAERIGQEFQIAQGFIDQYDIGRQGISGWGWSNVVQDEGWFEWIGGGTSFGVEQEIGDKIALVENEIWIDFVTRPKIRFSLNGSGSYERYGADEFKNGGIGFSIETNVGGAEGIAGSYLIGNLYDSDYVTGHVGFLILPFRNISLFPVLRFIKWDNTRWQWLTNTSISYQITEQAFFRFFFQAESKADPETTESIRFQDISNFNANLLFGYEFAPGTIFYLVYNQPRDFENDIVDHIFVAKFTYSIQF